MMVVVSEGGCDGSGGGNGVMTACTTTPKTMATTTTAAITINSTAISFAVTFIHFMLYIYTLNNYKMTKKIKCILTFPVIVQQSFHFANALKRKQPAAKQKPD